MEKLEFFLINGQTCIRREDGSSKPLTTDDRDAIDFMLENIKRYFPDAFDRLGEWAADSARNIPYYRFRMVDRFVRCNFGEADFMYCDVEDNMFHFEEVKCIFLERSPNASARQRRPARSRSGVPASV